MYSEVKLVFRNRCVFMEKKIFVNRDRAKKCNQNVCVYGEIKLL